MGADRAFCTGNRLVGAGFVPNLDLGILADASRRPLWKSVGGFDERACDRAGERL